MTHELASLLQFPRLLRLLSVLAFLMGVFWLDFSLPLGIAAPVLYAIPVSWVALWSRKRETKTLIATGFTATVFMALRYGLADAEHSDLALINRFLPFCVIWATIVIALFRKVKEEDRAMRETLSQALHKLTGRKARR